MTDLRTFQDFINALGYSSDESIFFRLIAPKDFKVGNEEHCKALPRLIYDKNGKKTVRKTNIEWNQSTGEVLGFEGQVKSNNIIEYLNSQSDLGLAVYIVVNPGGQSKKDITEARVIYYENDSHNINDQISTFNKLNKRWGGGFALQTSKSVHCYFRLSTSITPEDFTKIQKRLIAFLPGSDKCITDPCRVMRVPGFDHLKMVDNILVRTPIGMIHEWDGSFTNIDLINSDLPIIINKSSDLTSTKLNLTNIEMSKNIYLPSLIQFLAIEHREAIRNGVPLGQRDNMAYRVATDLVGSARVLTENGINFCETPEDLYAEYCSHCDSPKDDIWERVNNSEPNACLDIDKMAVNNKRFYERTMQDGVLGFDKKVEPKYSSSESDKYDSILVQELREIDSTEVKIPRLDADRASKLWASIKDRYPATVVRSIEDNTRRLGVRQYVYAMAYDTVMSGMVNSKFSVRNDSIWTEPLNIFTSIVGVPGVNKSHIINWLTSFHKDKNAEYRAELREAKGRYKTDYAEYLARHKQDPQDPDNTEPTEPQLRYASHGKTTHAKLIQALGTQKTDFKDSPNLMYGDEMTTLFGGDEKNGVNTSEIAVFLTGFSGGEITSSTKTDGVQGVSKTSLSILSTTQPETLRSMVSKLSQQNGFIDRILTPRVEETDTKKYDWLEEHQPTYPMGTHMETQYNKFANSEPDQEITISVDGRQALSIVEDWVFEKKSLRAKPKSYIIRIAGLYAIYENSTNPIINSHHVFSAWEVMKMDEYNKDQLGINKEPQGFAESTVDKVVSVLLAKGIVSAGSLSGQVHELRNVSVPDRFLIVQKVAEIMGDRAVFSTSDRGKVSLVLCEPKKVITTVVRSVVPESITVPEKEILVVQEVVQDIPVIEQDPIENKDVDKISLAVVLSEDTKEKEGLETVFIPSSFLGQKVRRLASHNNQYEVVESTDESITIRLDHDKTTVISRHKLNENNI